MSYRGVVSLVRSGIATPALQICLANTFSTTSTLTPTLATNAFSASSTFSMHTLATNAFGGTSINAFGGMSTLMLGSAANNAYHRRDTVEGINGLAALSAVAAAAIASSSSNDAAAKCEHDEEEAESTSQSVAKTNHNFSDVSTMDDIVDGKLAATSIEFTRSKLRCQMTSEEFVGSALHLHNSCETYKNGGDDVTRRMYNATMHPLLLDAICRPHGGVDGATDFQQHPGFKLREFEPNNPNHVKAVGKYETFQGLFAHVAGYKDWNDFNKKCNPSQGWHRSPTTPFHGRGRTPRGEVPNKYRPVIMHMEGCNFHNGGPPRLGGNPHWAKHKRDLRKRKREEYQE